MDDQALYRLMSWLTPENFFAGQPCSQGLEFAVETGLVRDAASLVAWVVAIMTHGAGHLDAVLFRAAYKAAILDDAEYFAEIAQVGASLLANTGAILASVAMGGAFLAMVRGSWPDPALDRVTRFWEGPIIHPVAVAAACAARQPNSRIPLGLALTAYLRAYVSYYVQTGIDLLRLPIEQAQLVNAQLEQPTLKAVRRAMSVNLDALADSLPMVAAPMFQRDAGSPRLVPN